MWENDLIKPPILQTSPAKPSVLDDRTRVIQAGEPVQVQAVLTELAFEAFNKRVLGRLFMLDGMQLRKLPRQADSS